MAYRPSYERLAAKDHPRDQLELAKEALCKWQRRKDRDEHPDGYFDNQHRWYPNEDEDCGVSENNRAPSRAWPFSLNTACRSLPHCVALVEKEYGKTLDPHTLAYVRRTAKRQGISFAEVDLDTL